MWRLLAFAGAGSSFPGANVGPVTGTVEFFTGIENQDADPLAGKIPCSHAASGTGADNDDVVTLGCSFDLCGGLGLHTSVGTLKTWIASDYWDYIKRELLPYAFVAFAGFADDGAGL